MSETTEIIQSRSISQSELSSECWAVQFRGLEACKLCEFKGTDECGGKDILNTGTNDKGLSVPLGTAF